MPIIVFDRVRVRRDGRMALALDRLVLDGPRIGIVGANGSGKSTLLRLVNGLILPDEGRVTVDGIDTREDARAVRRRVGLIFQNPEHQIVFPIVAEDMAFGLKNLGLPRAEREARAREGLAALGIAHLAERPSHALSGGETQLVALACVLVMRPDTVAFDEPTSGLDLANRNRVADAIAALDRQAIVASHDLALIAGLGRALVLDGGTVRFDGDAGEACARYVEMVG